MEKICRICLDEKKGLISFYSPPIHISYDIPTRIMACAKVEIQAGDMLPKKICPRCLNSLNLSYDFQTLCESSDRLLRSSIEEASCQGTLPNESSATESVAIKVEPIDGSEIEDLPLVHFLETSLGTSRRKRGHNLDANGNVEESEIRQQEGQRNLRPRIPKIEPTLSELFDEQLEDFLNQRKKRTYVRYKPLKEHKCEPCGKKFKLRKTKVLHDLKQHGIKTERKKKTNCQICQLPFDSWQLLLQHEKETRHHPKFQCEVCDRSFSRAYMTEHLKSHSGEKPFLCTLCGESFFTKGSFVKHTRRCMNVEKKLKCGYCDQRFHISSRLKDHERIHTNEKPFVCETCGKAFRRKSKLLIHQRSHSNLRPHTCGTCGRSFRTSTHLKEHSLIHSGIKPYVCSICGAGFTQGHSLKTHHIKHGPLDTSD